MNYSCCCGCKYKLVYQNSSCFMLYAIINIQSTVLGDTYHACRSLCFINKFPTILFLDNICSYTCGDMLCTDMPCILTDHSELVLSPGNQYKICSPHCIFLCNFLNSQASQIWHDFIRLWKILFIMKKREYLNVN